MNSRAALISILRNLEEVFPIERESHSQSSWLHAGRRAGAEAIVIGSGVAGLLAARVLADRFDRVTILERDALPEGPEPRKKTPQAPHSHIFGAYGYSVITTLFPGLDNDLRDAGAPAFDYLGDCRSFSGKWAPRYRSGIQTRICTRMFLEWRMRARLLERSNVRIISDYRVTGLLASADDRRIIGIIGEGAKAHYADLVVDAGGLGSRTPQWLSNLGYERPGESTVNLKGAIVSQVLKPPPDANRDWVMLVVRAVEGNPRSGSVMLIENGLWRVSLHGWSGCYPPKDWDGFLAFAQELAHPAFYEAIKDAEPVSPVYYYGRSMSRWVQYHKLQRFPDGLVVVGDAVFHPNPEHAQGMTFCVRAASLLARMLDDSREPIAEQQGLSLAFQRRLARTYAPYWSWNTGIELINPDAIAEQPDVVTRGLHHYHRQLRKVASSDPALLEAVVRAHQGERHPISLFHPAILWRVAKASVGAKSAAAYRAQSSPRPA